MTIHLGNRTPETQKHGENVCAVVVTHHPDGAFPARLSAVSRQVRRVVIVDNGSADFELRMLGELAADASIELVINAENLGVAQALNAGIQQAVAQGYTWVLLLDQDSEVAGDMVAVLLDVYASYPDRERLAVIGSHYLGDDSIGIDGQFGEAAGREIHSAQWDEVEAVITSGSLLPLAAYAAVGPFREEFFIDYVDIDYCLRARAKGYRVLKTKKQLMSHAIGSPSMHGWPWKRKRTTNHSADRRYYIARNDTVILRECGNYFAGGWAVKSLLRRLRQCRRILLYEQSKTDKIAAVAHGWWDGVRGRMGPRRARGAAAGAIGDGLSRADGAASSRSAVDLSKGTPRG